MSLLQLAWRVLVNRGEKHLLTAAVVALGLALMLTSVATEEAARHALGALAVRYPLVIGAEVGPAPLVLGSMTRLQDLPGHVDGALYAELEADPRVELAVPLMGGHAIGGFPVLGTSAGYLQPRERFPLARGRVFEEDGDEAVLGAAAAAGLGVGLSDEIAAEHRHGGAHESAALRVVGVLAETRTDTDRTVFVPFAAIHRSHGSADGMLGAVLVRPVDDPSLLSLHDEFEPRVGVQVALTGQTLRRISDQLSGGGRLLQLMVSGVVALTFLALLLSVYGTAVVQAREVAVMRMLGARRVQVVAVMGLVSLAVIGLGAVAGLGLSALLGAVTESFLRRQLGLEAAVVLLTPHTLGYLAATVALLGVAGVQPAVAAYGVPAAEVLADPGGGGQATRALQRWGVRLAVVLVGGAWGLQTLSTHGAEAVSVPLDEASRTLFYDLSGWGGRGEPPGSLAEQDGRRITVQGYMYALGDPYVVQDFYLVESNPRLPSCPFCYRAPTRAERIGVDGGGVTRDLLPGAVELTGTLHLESGADEPSRLRLEALAAILP